MNEVKALHEELMKDEIDFEEDIAFVAVYDPAVKLLNRHNGESEASSDTSQHPMLPCLPRFHGFITKSSFEELP